MSPKPENERETLTPDVLAIHQWIRDDAPISIKMVITPKLVSALASRLQAGRPTSSPVNAGAVEGELASQRWPDLRVSEVESVRADANAFNGMLRVSRENGFEDITDAITQAVSARKLHLGPIATPPAPATPVAEAQGEAMCDHPSEKFCEVCEPGLLAKTKAACEKIIAHSAPAEAQARVEAITSDDLVDMLAKAYEAGASDVQENYEENADPEFGEAARDYAVNIVEGRSAALLSGSTPKPSTADDEPQDEARKVAWADFEGDYLTDGNGYAAADVYRRCRNAFDVAWPQGRDAAMRAASLALANTINAPKPARVGEEDQGSSGGAESPCGSRDDQAVGATAALAIDLDVIRDILDRVQDEGDRVYLGSTNDVERLRRVADRLGGIHD